LPVAHHLIELLLIALVVTFESFDKLFIALGAADHFHQLLVAHEICGWSELAPTSSLLILLLLLSLQGWEQIIDGLVGGWEVRRHPYRRLLLSLLVFEPLSFHASYQDLLVPDDLLLGGGRISELLVDINLLGFKFGHFL